MTIFQKVTFNTLVSFLGRLVSGILAIVSIGFVTRGLGIAGFGEYSIILAYLATFQIFADLGLHLFLTKEISQNPEEETQLVSYFFTLRLLFVLGFLILGSVLVFLFPYSSNIKLGVIFSAFAFIFLSLNQIFLGIFQKYLQMHKVAFGEVAGRLLQLGVVWFSFKFSLGIFNYLSAMVLAAFSMFLINIIFIRRLIKFRLRFSVAYTKKILKKTLPIAISLVFTLLYFKMDIILLSLFKSQEEVGIYGAAYKTLEAIIFFPAAFVGIIFPILSRYSKENPEKLTKFLSGLGNLVTIVVLPITVMGVFLSSTIIRFIGGEEFLVAAPVLKILFLAIGIIFYGTLFGSAVIAMDLQKKAMWAYIFGFIFNLVTNLIFIPRYSYIGAAWTTVITEFIVTFLLICLVKKTSNFKFSYKIITKAFLASVFIGIGLFYFAGVNQEPVSAIKFFNLVFMSIGIYTVIGFTTNFIQKTKESLVIITEKL